MSYTQKLYRETPMERVVSERCMKPKNTFHHYEQAYPSKQERSVSAVSRLNAHKTTILIPNAKFHWDAPVNVLQHTPAISS